LLLDLWPLSRVRAASLSADRHPVPGTPLPEVSLTRAVLEKVPFAALSAVSVLLSPLSVRAAGIVMPHETAPLGLRLGNAVVGYVAYLDKILAPRNLAIFYPYPAHIPIWKTLTAASLLVAVTVVVIRGWQTRAFLVVGWLWFLGTLVPVSGLLQAGLWPAMADRWAYVPLVGVAVMIAWTATDLAERGIVRRRVLVGCALAILLVLLAGTMLQVERWRSTVALFEHATLVTSRNHVAHTNLGSALLDEGRVSEAIVHLNEALRLQPRLPHAHNSLGIALARQGDLRGAVRHFAAALDLNPDFEEARANLELAQALLTAPADQQRATTGSFSTGIMGLTGPRSRSPGRLDDP
jgi:hypothetical protein